LFIGLSWTVKGVLLEVLTLLSLGFVVGLSGAVIPGPLLAFTVFDTTRKRQTTGHSIILGHALWESVIILIIFLGFGWIITQNRLVIYVIGGLALAFMGISIVRSRGGEIRMESSKVSSSLIGGVFYTVFNPTQPPWWATAGLALLLKGAEIMGIIGVVIMTLGHWLSDFAYYGFVSFMVHRHERYINPRQRETSILLGAYFLVQGLQHLVL